MGKASSSKKVARAARAGGGARAAANRSLLFPGSLAIVVVLGVALIVFARSERQGQADDTPPRVTDHWHTAYGFYICDQYLGPDTDRLGDRFGIHTHDDGIIHTHPRPGSTGRDASLARFFDEIGADISDSRLELPDGREFENGDTCEGLDEPGQLRVLVWEDPFGEGDEPSDTLTENLSSIRQQDREAIAIVFAPEDAEIPKPPTIDNLNNLTDVAPTIPPPPEPGTTDDTDGSDTTDTTEGSDPTDTTEGSDTTDTTEASDTTDTTEG